MMLSSKSVQQQIEALKQELERLQQVTITANQLNTETERRNTEMERKIEKQMHCVAQLQEENKILKTQAAIAKNAEAQLSQAEDQGDTTSFPSSCHDQAATTMLRSPSIQSCVGFKLGK